MKSRFIVLFQAVLILIYPVATTATKPCLPSLCLGENHKPDSGKCFALADWVVTGHIVDVIHHPAGYPANKDFAEFVFEISRWEKGEKAGLRKMKFKVGWCVNRKEIPGDHAGIFRFYGAGEGLPEGSDPASLNWQYEHFDRIPDD